MPRKNQARLWFVRQIFCEGFGDASEFLLLARQKIGFRYEISWPIRRKINAAHEELAGFDCAYDVECNRSCLGAAAIIGRSQSVGHGRVYRSGIALLRRDFQSVAAAGINGSQTVD